MNSTCKIDKDLFINPDRADYYISNLLKLANYLESLPDGYEKFGMNVFAEDEHGDHLALPEVIEKPTQYLHHCGSVACAVGHGPAAGVFPAHSFHFESWGKYSEEVFGLPRYDDEWEWCFGGEWEVVDNTPQGAAFRIKKMLEGFKGCKGIAGSDEVLDIPEDYKEQIMEKGHWK